MKIKVAFLLFEGALGLDITGPLEVFHTLNRLLSIKNKDSFYMFEYYAEKEGLVELSSGLKIQAEKRLDCFPSADLFIIPGGISIGEKIQNKPLISLITECSKRSEKTVCICGGAFLLAETGLLKGRKVTTHWGFAEDLKKKIPT